MTDRERRDEVEAFLTDWHQLADRTDAIYTLQVRDERSVLSAAGLRQVLARLSAVEAERDGLAAKITELEKERDDLGRAVSTAVYLIAAMPHKSGWRDSTVYDVLAAALSVSPAGVREDPK